MRISVRLLAAALLAGTAACEGAEDFRPEEETVVAHHVSLLASRMAAANLQHANLMDVVVEGVGAGAGKTTVPAMPMASAMEATALRMDYASSNHALVAWTSPDTFVLVLIQARVPGYADGSADFGADSRVHAFIMEGENAVWRATEGTASIALKSQDINCGRSFTLPGHSCKRASFQVQLNIARATPWQAMAGNTATGTRAVTIAPAAVRGAYIAGSYVGAN